MTNETELDYDNVYTLTIRKSHLEQLIDVRRLKRFFDTQSIQKGQCKVQMAIGDCHDWYQ
jgi:hypothetical protein